MMRNRGGILILMLMFLVSSALQSVYADPALPVVDGQLSELSGTSCDGYLVKLQEPAGQQAVLMDDLNTAEGDTLITDEIILLHEERKVEDLLKNGMAEYAEPNWEVELLEGSLLTAEAEQQAEDSAAVNGWAYESMKIQAAREKGLTGEGVRVGLIDSGVNRGDADLEEACILEGYNYLDNTSDVSDDVGHGTRVTRMIAGDEDGTGVTGVARGAEIVPLKCFSSKTSHVSDLILPITDAVDQYHCDIINMSWGIKSLNNSNSKLLQESVEHAWKQGVVMMAAAGNVNGSYPQGTILYPAAYNQVVGVGSVNQDLSRASFSQETEAVYVVAPGTAVIDSVNGTSFSCPCVSGAAALLLQEDPALSPPEVMKKLRDYSVDLGGSGYEAGYGWGFVRMDRMLGHVYISMSLHEESEESGPAAGENPEEEARIDTVQEETEDLDGTVCLHWHNPQDQQKAVLAEYDAEGRMLRAKIMDLRDEQYAISSGGMYPEGVGKEKKIYQYEIPVEYRTAAVRLMILDEESRPVEHQIAEFRNDQTARPD